MCDTNIGVRRQTTVAETHFPGVYIIELGHKSFRTWNICKNVITDITQRSHPDRAVDKTLVTGRTICLFHIHLDLQRRKKSTNIARLQVWQAVLRFSKSLFEPQWHKLVIDRLIMLMSTMLRLLWRSDCSRYWHGSSIIFSVSHFCNSLYYKMCRWLLRW